METKELIHAYMQEHREEYIEDLKALVRINSQRSEALEGKPFGEGPARAIDAAMGMVRSYGFTVKNYENYVMTADFSDAPRQLDILAHLDVVPAGEGWSITEPFEPKLIGSRIYGRGVSDDKGPALAALYAMRAIKDLGLPMKNSVRLILGADEECGSGDLEYYFKKEKSAPMSFSPDANFPVVNIEKGGLNGRFTADFSQDAEKIAAENEISRVKEIRCGVKINVVPPSADATIVGVEKETAEAYAAQTEKETGVRFQISEMEEDNTVVLKVHAEGKNGHAAFPEGGNNALTGIIAYLARLPLADLASARVVRSMAKLFPHGDYLGNALGVAMEDEISGPLTLSFDMLTLTQEGMQGIFDSRVPICANRENVAIPIQKLLAKHDMILQNTEMRKPHHVPAESRLVQTLLACYSEFTGREAKPLYTGGGTYVHEIENGVAFGCEDDRLDPNMHGPNEVADIELLLESAEIFAAAILRLCN